VGHLAGLNARYKKIACTEDVVATSQSRLRFIQYGFNTPFCWPAECSGLLVAEAVTPPATAVLQRLILKTKDYSEVAVAPEREYWSAGCLDSNGLIKHPGACSSDLY
jgi:hypothetical protein